MKKICLLVLLSLCNYSSFTFAYDDEPEKKPEPSNYIVPGLIPIFGGLTYLWASKLGDKTQTQQSLLKANQNTFNVMRGNALNNLNNMDCYDLAKRIVNAKASLFEIEKAESDYLKQFEKNDRKFPVRGGKQPLTPNEAHYDRRLEELKNAAKTEQKAQLSPQEVEQLEVELLTAYLSQKGNLTSLYNLDGSLNPIAVISKNYLGTAFIDRLTNAFKMQKLRDGSQSVLMFFSNKTKGCMLVVAKWVNGIPVIGSRIVWVSSTSTYLLKELVTNVSTGIVYPVVKFTWRLQGYIVGVGGGMYLSYLNSYAAWQNDLKSFHDRQNQKANEAIQENAEVKKALEDLFSANLQTQPELLFILARLLDPKEMKKFWEETEGLGKDGDTYRMLGKFPLEAALALEGPKPAFKQLVDLYAAAFPLAIEEAKKQGVAVVSMEQAYKQALPWFFDSFFKKHFEAQMVNLYGKDFSTNAEYRKFLKVISEKRLAFANQSMLDAPVPPAPAAEQPKVEGPKK